ncbi:hypothetical protein [Cylindrospermum stagnale]|nr:hypothetical protein [Cylindrospermum stagnale]
MLGFVPVREFLPVGSDRTKHLRDAMGYAPLSSDRIIPSLANRFR